MAYDLNDLVTTKQLGNAAQRAHDEAKNLQEQIKNKLTGVYKAKGSLAPAGLVSSLLIPANEGFVYNITGDFTTTADFIEGAGKKHTAGTNVAIIEAVAPVYTASTDTTVNAGKTYYAYRNNGYSVVVPAGNENPSEEGWFEMATPGVYKFDVHAGDLSNLQVLAVPTASGNLALLDATGQVTDSTVAIAEDEEVAEMLDEIYGA